jgi:hypothetical protein
MEGWMSNPPSTIHHPPSTIHPFSPQPPRVGFLDFRWQSLFCIIQPNILLSFKSIKSIRGHSALLDALSCLPTLLFEKTELVALSDSDRGTGRGSEATVD